jgi:hypothetical protein
MEQFSAARRGRNQGFTRPGSVSDDQRTLTLRMSLVEWDDTQNWVMLLSAIAIAGRRIGRTGARG